jgi:peroxiredoxin
MTSKLITPGELAPDFELEDIQGNRVRLSDFRENMPVVLAFLRGFM